MSLRAPVLNQATQLEGVPVGGTAVINTSGLPVSITGWTLTISNQPAVFSIGANGQITAIVPSGALIGPAVVQLNSPSGNYVPPIVMQVDLAAPVITTASSPLGGAAAAAPPAFHAGDTVSLMVVGLTDQFGNLPPAASVDINIGGVDQNSLTVSAASSPAATASFQV